MIEELPPFKETKAAVLTCGKGQKTVCVCVCVCVYVCIGVGSVEEKTLCVCVCVGVGSMEDFLHGYLAWQDETHIPGSHFYKGNTFDFFMPNRFHIRLTVQGYFRKSTTDYL